MSATPRIALIAFRLESNGHAPVINRPEFETNGYLCGRDILDDLARPRADHADRVFPVSSKP